MKKALAFVLAVVLLLPMLSAGASAIESYTLEVGDTKLLKIDSSGKALENSVWESNSPDVIVTESNLTYCTVQAVAPTEGMTAIAVSYTHLDVYKRQVPPSLYTVRRKKQPLNGTFQKNKCSINR